MKIYVKTESIKISFQINSLTKYQVNAKHATDTVLLKLLNETLISDIHTAMYRTQLSKKLTVMFCGSEK